MHIHKHDTKFISSRIDAKRDDYAIARKVLLKKQHFKLFRSSYQWYLSTNKRSFPAKVRVGKLSVAGYIEMVSKSKIAIDVQKKLRLFSQES